MTDARILVGDCREQLANIADNSIDAIITDPPYELGFMGKTWDASGVAYDTATWQQCLRVLKPGGHLCAFGGTRTYHRMTVAIEDAGFEIRDSIHWLYGSGFPKSLDVSKAIDKQRHDRADVYRVTAWVRNARDAAGIGNRQIDDAFGFSGMAGHWTSSASQPVIPTLEQIPTLLDVLGITLDDVPDDIRQLIWTLNGRKGQPGENWAKREVVGTSKSTRLEVAPGEGRDRPQIALDVTAPATDAARQWDGWGTALKPAHEPIVLARKPLIGTVAQNVLEHGTGAINIDASRIGGSDGGRWPSNLLITHHHACTPIGTASDTYGGGRHATSGFASGYAHDGFAATTTPVTVYDCHPECPAAILNRQSTTTDTSGASRYFTQTCWDQDADVASFRYVAKPSKRERNAGLDHLDKRDSMKWAGDNAMRGLAGKYPDGTERPQQVQQNTHPTVKPVALMRWLIRLTTTENAVILDPFLGSGTTAVAATLEHRNWIGCELTGDYLPIIEGRVTWAEQQDDTATPVVPTTDTTTTTANLTLFNDPQ